MSRAEVDELRDDVRALASKVDRLADLIGELLRRLDAAERRAANLEQRNGATPQ